MTDQTQAPITAEDMSLLIVDDDKPFQQRLARAMEKRGFAIDTADGVQDAAAKIARGAPAFAIVDMRLEDGNGLDVIEQIRQKRPDARAIVLTGYGNIATAVTAVKLGAIDYLAKPADPDDIVAALARKPEDKAQPPENPMSADRVRWNISSGSMNCATATCPKRRGGSTCTGARCSGSWPNGPHADGDLAICHGKACPFHRHFA